MIMASERADIRPEDFKDAAESFGYRYVDASFGQSTSRSEPTLFNGRVGLSFLPCGVALCNSELHATVDSAHEGTVGRSLAVVFNLAPEPSNSEFGSGRRLWLDAHGASVLTVAETIRLAGAYRAGQRCKSLLVRVDPESVADEDVADQIESVLFTTATRPFPMTHQMTSIVHELSAPTATGGIGRILSESLALEVIARGLLFIDQERERPAPGVSARDRARLMRVQEMLIANPAGEVTLAMLAREAGMSVSSLKAKFPRVFGKPVVSYLRDLRMEQARRGIEDEGWSISEAAYFSGYHHHTDFSAAFRRKFGIAPSALKSLRRKPSA